MKNQKLANKTQGLYKIALQRIQRCKGTREIIRFPLVFESICRSFSITKKDAWELLSTLQEMDVLEIVPFHGVRLK